MAVRQIDNCRDTFVRHLNSRPQRNLILLKRPLRTCNLSSRKMPADKVAFMAAIPPSMDAIKPHVCLGNMVFSLNYIVLQYNNIKAIVSLTDQPSTRWDNSNIRMMVPKSHHLCVQWAENAIIDLIRLLPSICRLIDKHVQNGNVLVHCELGYSRSPAVIVGWLMRKYRINPEQALGQINAKSRRKLYLSDNFVEQLYVWGGTRLRAVRG